MLGKTGVHDFVHGLWAHGDDFLNFELTKIFRRDMKDSSCIYAILFRRAEQRSPHFPEPAFLKRMEFWSVYI